MQGVLVGAILTWRARHYADNHVSVRFTGQRSHRPIVGLELTFLNQVVHLLTLGIYTPMRIRVTCAQRSAASTGAAALAVPAGSGDSAVRAVFRGAADQTVQQRQAVLVYFEQNEP